MQKMELIVCEVIDSMQVYGSSTYYSSRLNVRMVFLKERSRQNQWSYVSPRNWEQHSETLTLHAAFARRRDLRSSPHYNYYAPDAL